MGTKNVKFYTKNEVRELKEIAKLPPRSAAKKEALQGFCNRHGRDFVSATQKISALSTKGSKSTNTALPKATVSTRDITIGIKSILIQDNKLIIKY